MDYRIFGYNVFATHLPLALGVSACAVAGMDLGTARLGRPGGVLRGARHAHRIGVFLFTRIFIPEALLTCFSGLALYAFSPGSRIGSRRAIYIACVGAGPGMLAKGLIAPVFFFAAVVPYLWSPAIGGAGGNSVC